MAATAPSPQLASLTIPAEYLEDAREAVRAEIDSDTDALRMGAADDLEPSARLLGRTIRLLEPLLKATGETTLTAENDRTSSPLVDTLEGMIRLVLGRLRDAAQYGPMPMADVLDLAAEVRWAAEEAIRIEPEIARRLTSNEWTAAAS